MDIAGRQKKPNWNRKIRPYVHGMITLLRALN